MISGTICFDPSDPVYRVHFPGNPVVPGSLVVEAFKRVLISSGISPENTIVRKFRFRSFLKPGDYTYQIIEEGSVFKCTLFEDAKRIVTGEIVL